MHQEQLTVVEAINRLRKAGYHIEHGHGIIYARRKNPDRPGNGVGIPDRVYERITGFVSALAVKKLENKMAKRS